MTSAQVQSSGDAQLLKALQLLNAVKSTGYSLIAVFSSLRQGKERAFFPEGPFDLSPFSITQTDISLTNPTGYIFQVSTSGNF